jgi:hypothetical protein
MISIIVCTIIFQFRSYSAGSEVKGEPVFESIKVSLILINLNVLYILLVVFLFLSDTLMDMMMARSSKNLEKTAKKLPSQAK